MHRKKKNKRWVRLLPIFGCISTGIIYFGIGVIALLSFLKLKEGGADESSMLEFLDNFWLGKIFIWVILLGTVSYMIWRIYESIKDPYEYGNGLKGISKRTGIALSTIADAFIAFTAIQVLLGTGNIKEDGQPQEQRELISGLLKEDMGPIIIIGLGIIVGLTALVQLFYGVTQGYKERLDMAQFGPKIKTGVHILAWLGYFARGIILGIVGFFYIKAGVEENGQLVVNTDKAFDFIGDHLGPIYFILVAFGTICYGLFMFVLGITYDTDD